MSSQPTYKSSVNVLINKLLGLQILAINLTIDRQKILAIKIFDNDNHPLDVVEPPKIRDNGFQGGRCEVYIVNP